VTAETGSSSIGRARQISAGVAWLAANQPIQLGGHVLYRILAGAAASVALLSSVAAGQACQGNLPFRGSMHIGGGASLTDHTTTLGAGLLTGHREGLFGGGSVGLTDYQAGVGSAFSMNGALGYSMPLQGARNWEFCPGGTLSLGFGPNAGGADIRTQTMTGGVSAGTSLPLSRNVSLLPYGSVALGYTRATVSGFPGSASDTYFLFGFGAGFKITPSLVIQPSVGFAVATDNPDDTMFGINVSWALPNGHDDAPRPTTRRR
jgi:opacity protein-like surface antigen